MPFAVALANNQAYARIRKKDMDLLSLPAIDISIICHKTLLIGCGIFAKKTRLISVKGMTIASMPSFASFLSASARKTEASPALP